MARRAFLLALFLTCASASAMAASQPASQDRDGDGVLDSEDLCPDAPGPRENHGCPVFTDKDHDGVADDVDRCPDDPGVAENFGCPWPDRDADGVPDKDDKCPEVPGPKDNQGCPRQASLITVHKDRIELKEQIRFRPTKSEVLSDSYEVLRQVAQALKEEPQAAVRIEGHTDNVGGLKRNVALSQARADAVKEFLVQEGVDPKRLTAVGYGPARPVASNATRAGKALNRRVEFRLEEGNP